MLWIRRAAAGTFGVRVIKQTIKSRCRQNSAIVGASHDDVVESTSEGCELGASVGFSARLQGGGLLAADGFQSLHALLQGRISKGKSF